jgi:hypothetical protein
VYHELITNIESLVTVPGGCVFISGPPPIYPFYFRWVILVGAAFRWYDEQERELVSHIPGQIVQVLGSVGNPVSSRRSAESFQASPEKKRR